MWFKYLKWFCYTFVYIDYISAALFKNVINTWYFYIFLPAPNKVLLFRFHKSLFFLAYIHTLDTISTALKINCKQQAPCCGIFWQFIHLKYSYFHNKQNMFYHIIKLRIQLTKYQVYYYAFTIMLVIEWAEKLMKINWSVDWDGLVRLNKQIQLNLALPLHWSYYQGGPNDKVVCRWGYSA